MKTRLGQLGGLVPILFLASSVFVAGEVRAAEAVGASKAEEAVREALQREVYGLLADRDSLLSSAIDAAPDNSAARWHQGYLRGTNGEWVVGGEPTDKEHQELLALYGKLRAAAANTAAGQIEMADWCARKGLKERERIHLMRVCELSPDNITARQRLGFVRVGRDWVSKADIAFAQNREAAQQKAATHWNPIVTKLAAQLASPDAQKRVAAVLQIKEIRDASALPTLQQLVGRRGEDEELLVVEVASKIDETDATVALARHAVMSPSLLVRQTAAKLLTSRDREDFVPLLLSAMYSPVVSRISEFALPNGQIGYRHAFMREGADHNEVLVLNTSYRRIGPNNTAPNGNQLLSLNRAARDAQMEEGVAAQNQYTAELNDRLSWVLNTATDAKLPAEPDKWWKWWADENEVFMPGSKQNYTVSRSRSVDIVEIDPKTLIPPKPSNMVLLSVEVLRPSIYTPAPSDCLVAGTPVWTDRGTVAIESMLAGDMVLSRDIETGELSYKAVVRTTTRPPGPIIRIKAGDEFIECSSGHPLWVSGNGWVKSRNLQTGMVLHAASGPVRVSEVSEVKAAPTFNLIVADNNTYFVGNQKVLSHDNTLRRPTNAIVPGLKP
ncbi:polymorphic toxin-type HINT domain-containing protein [Anatilimnocola floriformis]|uniref:polymorphic toxin-type HINT domain-containing protein n=1 Tax=Anatilimnocola floriformis TaxID=2948575 RepID=UPI0020C55AF0|nr:polymorphic toxin-type HINT domain-containing protein [Anatilimnocola floriformis]